MADLKGKKIRAAGNSSLVAQAQGAVPAEIAPAEQYTALQRGTVDGIVYPFYCGVSYKLYEVVKYASWPPMYVVSAHHLLVNLDAWNSLPKEYQDILKEEAHKMEIRVYKEIGPALDKMAQEKGTADYGVENVWLSDEEFSKLGKATLPLWDKWAAQSDYSTKLVQICKKVAGIK